MLSLTRQWTFLAEEGIPDVPPHTAKDNEPGDAPGDDNPYPKTMKVAANHARRKKERCRGKAKGKGGGTRYTHTDHEKGFLKSLWVKLVCSRFGAWVS